MSSVDTWTDQASRVDWREFILPKRTIDEFWAEGKAQAEWLGQYYRRSETVCDIGAGVGRVLRYIYAASRVGVEPVNSFRERLEVQLGPNDFVASNVEDVEPGTVDFAYCLMVYQHIDDHEQWRLTNGIVRMLRPGGRALIQLPCGEYYNMDYEEQFKLATRAASHGAKFDAVELLTGRLVGYGDECPEGDQELFILGEKT